MLLRPPSINQQVEENLSQLNSESDAHQSSRSKNKVKKKQNSLSFRSRPTIPHEAKEKERENDGGSVHSYASSRSKKSKKKQSSIGNNRARAYLVPNSPNKSDPEDIEVVDYAQISEKPKPRVFDFQESEVKPTLAPITAYNYSPIVDSPSPSPKPSFLNVIKSGQEMGRASKQELQDDIPVVKLVENNNASAFSYNNPISKVQKKQTRKLGQLFQESRRNSQNSSELGVSAVPSESGIGGESRRSKSKLGQLFKEKSKEKESSMNNNSRVSFTENSSSNFNYSVSNSHLQVESNLKGPIPAPKIQALGNNSRQKMNVNRINIPEKVLEQSVGNFEEANRLDLNLSMSRNSPPQKHDLNNKDSVCFNLEPERERKRKGLGLASKMVKEEEMLKISGNLYSKELTYIGTQANLQSMGPSTMGPSVQSMGPSAYLLAQNQAAHDRLRMNLQENEKYLAESGMMGRIQPKVQTYEEEKKEKELEIQRATEEKIRLQKIRLEEEKLLQMRREQELRNQQDRNREEARRAELESKEKAMRREEELKQQREMEFHEKKKQMQQEKRKLEADQLQLQQELKRQEQIRKKDQMKRQEQVEIQRENERRARAEKEQREAEIKRKRVVDEDERRKKEKEREKEKEMENRRKQNAVQRQRKRRLEGEKEKSFIYELDSERGNEYKIPSFENLPSTYSNDHSEKGSERSKESRKSTRKKEGVITRHSHKHLLGEASPRAEESFYQENSKKLIEKEPKMDPKSETMQIPRKLMSFNESDDMGELKNEYKTDTYFYDKSSKTHSRPPLSRKSGSKSKPKESSISKKPSKDSQIKINQPQQKGGDKKLSLVELAMRKSYQPGSGSECQSQDSFRSRENSINSSGSRNSMNSRGSRKKQSVVRMKQNAMNTNRPPLYRKTSSETEENLESRVEKHERELKSREKYADIERRKQEKPTVIKGCSFIDGKGRLVQNGNMVIKGSQVSGYSNSKEFTEQRFIERLMNSRERRRSKSRDRSLNRSRASNGSNGSTDKTEQKSRYNKVPKNQFVESQAYSETEYNRFESGSNFYGTKRNGQSPYYNKITGSQARYQGTNYKTVPHTLQQFVKPIEEAGIERQRQMRNGNEQELNNKKKRSMQRTERI